MLYLEALNSFSTETTRLTLARPDFGVYMNKFVIIVNHHHRSLNPNNNKIVMVCISC